MEETERYIYIKIDGYYWIKDTETNENYCVNKSIVKLLNQQDKRIKELEERTKTLKTSKAHFKKIAENVVELLKKLNKFIGEPQTQDLNYYKVIEDTKNYIEELKQSQKRLAIDKLKLMLDNFKNRPTYFDVARQELCLNTLDKKFIDFIKNEIKELKGEENDKN